MINAKSILDQLNQLEEGGELTAQNMDVSILSDFDMTFFHRLFWVSAKSANPRVKAFDVFFMEMEEFPIQEIGPVLMEMLNQGMSTRKKSMKPMEASEEIFTVESYLSCCKETGLSIDDLKHISIGMALDYQTDYVALRSDKPQTRRATQADFDNF